MYDGENLQSLRKITIIIKFPRSFGDKAPSNPINHTWRSAGRRSLRSCRWPGTSVVVHMEPLVSMQKTMAVSSLLAASAT
jgi:hypothetical protein